MTFKDSIITCIQFKYADFKGRASRSEYWYFMLFVILLYIAASVLDLIIFGHAQGPLYTISALALLVPNIAVAIRRLHDIGKKGWWVLIALIPLIGLAIIYFFCQPSDPASNEYGEPPIS